MATVQYEKGKLYEISIIDLKHDPNQPRKSMDPIALEELTASIKTHGIIQPILFRVAADTTQTSEIGGHDVASCPPISRVFPGGYSPRAQNFLGVVRLSNANISLSCVG